MKKEKIIPFNKPFIVGKELGYISEAHDRGQLSGDGVFTKKCQKWLESNTGCKKALLTHSCTAALEMAAILLDLKQGDEVIMPSYTFVSTANAFVLRGAVPVFVDIRPDTLNLDESKIEQAITSRTRAIVPVHYAGVPCEMDAIMQIADKYNLFVVEDAAQGLLSRYKGKALGSIGHLGAVSFHETKNIISGEGGALLINSAGLCDRAEVIREKGTNRAQFFRGQVDKYTWVDIGSSYLPGELIAAFLWAQMEQAEYITSRRLSIWRKYDCELADWAARQVVVRPYIPDHAIHNAHMYYLIMRDLHDRTKFIDFMKGNGVSCVFHYVPLHNASKGIEYGKTNGSLENTIDLSDRLVRLPIWLGVEVEQDYIIDKIHQYVG